MTLATPAEQFGRFTVGARVPVQMPMSASPSVGLEVEMSRFTPVASVPPPATLIAFGLDPEGLIVTVIEADLEGSAWLVAVMVTGLLPVGRAAGALYLTLVAVPPMIVPIVELPLVTVPASVPATVQVRAVFEVPVTEAVIPKVPPTVALAGLGGLVMETTRAAADMIVMLTEADLVLSATLVAVMLNVAGVGTDGGAL